MNLNNQSVSSKGPEFGRIRMKDTLESLHLELLTLSLEAERHGDSKLVSRLTSCFDKIEEVFDILEQ